MVIYIAFFQSSKQHNIPAYSFWEYYIKNGIEEAGHQWIESNVDWAEAHTYTQKDEAELLKWKSNTWQIVLDDILKFLEKKKIDMFLSYFYPNHIDELAIKEIQKSGIKCVNFFCDNVRDFKSIPDEFKVFDLNWVPEYKALKLYSKGKMPYIHLPMPMWVEPKFRKTSLNESNRVSFIGSKDVQRIWLFNELAKSDVDFDVYGSGWQNEPNVNVQSAQKSNLIANQVAFLKNNGITAFYRKAMSSFSPKVIHSSLYDHIKEKPTYEDYVKLTQESMITLGVNRYPSFDFPFSNPNSYSRLRDIEAPMLGACYLTEYTEGLENMYEIGEEIETYKNEDDLVEKIKYLKSNEAQRKKLRLNGQKITLSQHSIPNSLHKIFKL